MKEGKLFDLIDPDLNLRIINEDVLQYVREMGKEKFKLIITSPPYNIGKEYETKTTIDKYIKTQKEIIEELVAVLSPEGSICWQVGNYVKDGEIFPLDIFYYNIFKEHGLKLRNRIVWRFGHGLHASNRFSGRYETILWFTKEDNYTFNLDDVRIPSKYPGKRHYKGPNKGELSGNPKGKNPSDVWEVVLRDWEKEWWEFPNVKSNHVEKTEHPCQYPVELVERCILALTNKKDWVLDPFAGVGSTGIAALKNERNAVLIDKEKKYCDVAKNRINQLKEGKLKTRPLTKPIHKPSKKSKIAQMPKEWKQLNLKD
jgi:DNA modification methylase